MSLGHVSSPSETDLQDAGRTFLGAITSGGLWVDALDALMPRLRCLGGTLSRIMPPPFSGVPSSTVLETFQAIGAGRTPPMTAATRLLPGPHEGFLCDQMDAFRRPRERDAFYMEFIRGARGLAYQASAHLDGTGRDTINFMVFRERRSGGFDPADLSAFTVLLPYLRAATMASRGALSRNADHAAARFRRRGDPVIGLSYDGRVLDAPPEAIALIGPDIVIANGRLRARLAADQRRIDQTLASALASRRPGLVTLMATDGRSHFRLLMLPLLGPALDIEVFRATAVLVVVLDVSRRIPVDEEALHMLVASAALTPRETEITRLVASGHTPREAATRLGIGYETARLHLKAVYGKAEVRSHADLMALLHRYSPL